MIQLISTRCVVGRSIMWAGKERRGIAVRKCWRCVLPGPGGFLLSSQNEHIVCFDILDNTTLLVPQGSSPPPTRLLADYPPTSLDVRVAYAVLEAKGETVYVPVGLSWRRENLGGGDDRTWGDRDSGRGWVFSMYVSTSLAGVPTRLFPTEKFRRRRPIVISSQNQVLTRPVKCLCIRWRGGANPNQEVT
jgi:hypothetical protein